jgi:hypothetical protein
LVYASLFSVTYITLPNTEYNEKTFSAAVPGGTPGSIFGAETK